MMNIFRTSDGPRLSAIALDDARVVKMTLETAQILSTALRLHGVDDGGPLPCNPFIGYLRGLAEDAHLYKATHARHPCTVWTAACRGNFRWLADYGFYLAAEYERRFRRDHRSAAVIYRAVFFYPALPEGPETPPPFCGPADLLPNAPVTERYRALLNRKWAADKRPPKWTMRRPPEWRGAHLSDN